MGVPAVFGEARRSWPDPPALPRTIAVGFPMSRGKPSHPRNRRDPVTPGTRARYSRRSSDTVLRTANGKSPTGLLRVVNPQAGR